MRFLKGIAWWLVVSALGAAVTLAAMRRIAAQSGSADLYEKWMGEIRDAFEEAREFAGEGYEGIKRRTM